MGEHYFSGAPNVPSRPHVVRFRIDGHDVALASDRGVFSAERLDPGTGVLLRAVPSSAGRSLLDLGCGYGPITCVLAERNPAAMIWAVDVNARARALTEQNVAAAGYADQVRVCAPEEVPPDVSFDEIWSNPPVRIGKAALHELLQTWLARLRPDGVAWLVVARNLGSDSLQRWLAGQGFDVQRHTSAQGYRVLQVRRGAAEAF
jgi:16S rRNA (guanine1207-N2)-methyltransferase